ncbi:MULTISPECIES: serine/threonine-protein kinase [Streptomyces]|uniref:serine/threonine-protein kinase n=2 Tax=Streptomyces scabiei TaxID=1930 RepID=UPI0004E64582|nr:MULTISPECIES: serine/threonine-protein kinase [Streptomyces]MBP5864082.1 serine/threonine protein kinase [Streptomyces sp. LBUM 1484]KFG05396.1 serine/threonine protein kinase [Streptomyces scabiei]MBP5883054.1 serine/threonine protein kinase [Streptomyces sp. LBUM 1487]MBP5899135.1 serine/threonine protein kinase [Streptomyces sp. LBUM 1488]MBP5924324.1 serine/threonine protein kinase [Streptomyces sp. LBUM 1483]
MHIAPLSPDDPPELGGYELLGRIGQGGMGQVYLGESPGGEPAAVKVIKPSVVDSETRLRFAQEVEILKTIWGARIAALLDADPEADPPWLATEYVEGLDLSRHVAGHGPLDALLTASLGATLAEALATVHKQGLLHRDLKPANVLLGPNGPKVIDFGLAVFAESSVSLTAANTVVGTPSCMPPEQANGEKPLTTAVDVYALGAVLLFASSGHAPYRADNIHLLFHQVVDASITPDLSGAPEELVPLLTAMLAHRPQDRPALDEVVRRCRALIEARGLKVAQARRRLTNFTAAPAHVLDDLLAVARPVAPGSAPASARGAAPGSAARARTSAAGPAGPGGQLEDAPPTPPTPVPPPADPRLLFARIDIPAAPPAAPSADTTTAGTPPTDETVRKPDHDRGRPAARSGSGTSNSNEGSTRRRSLRHSAQARITAQRLREAYAASGPF